MTEQEEFLKELDINEKSDVLNAPLTEGEPEKEESDEEVEQKAKNRRERRLLEKNQQLREEAIVATTRLQALSEAKQLRSETQESEFETLVEKLYGTATPEAKEATEILKKALRGVKDSAKAEALEEYIQRAESDRANESQAVEEEEDNLEDIMDSVEEDYGINMSEGSSDRKNFLSLMEELSPKDREGNIIEFADPDATAKIYLSQKGKTNARAKELSSRSLTHSGSSQETKLEASAAERFLKENGII